MYIGIICAMKQEIKKLKAAVKNLGVKSIMGHIFYTGDINGVNIVMVKNIQGKVDAAICTTLLLSNFDIDLVINVGYASALDDTLKKGDIAISSDTVEFDIDRTQIGYDLGYVIGLSRIFVPCDEHLVETIHEVVDAEGVNCKIGTICSGDVYIGERNTVKKRLQDEFNAIAVDMESSSVNHVCQYARKKFITLRIIYDDFDPAEEPKFLEESVRVIDNIVYRYLITSSQKKIYKDVQI